MKNVLSKLRCGVFGLPLEEISYARRGFRGATELMRARLEQVGAAFHEGYSAALGHGRAEGLEAQLETVEHELRGFAFEGAAMGLALLDALTPWRPNRLPAFLRGAAEPHVYMGHVGAGWVWAFWPLPLWTIPSVHSHLDPLLYWLAYDGWGFHEGFFHWPKYIQGRTLPRRFKGYQRRAFDQGLGRSFWFVNGGNVDLISSTIGAFDELRQADLWSGIGLAATYAGIVGAGTLAGLRDRARAYWPHLAQGSAFAAKARQRAGNSTEYTELAVEVLCGIPASRAASLCDEALEQAMGREGHGTTDDGTTDDRTTDHGPQDHRTTGPRTRDHGLLEPAYELWRRRIQDFFASQSDQSDRSDSTQGAYSSSLLQSVPDT